MWLRFLTFTLLLFISATAIAQPADYKNIQLSHFKELRPVTIGSFDNNKPTYIKLWASWCQPCMEQMPHFQQLQQQYGDKMNVLAVNININENRAAIHEVIKKFNLSMPVLLDNNSQLALALGLVGTPMSVLLNTKGEIVYTSHESDKNLDVFVKKLASGEQLPPATVAVLSQAEQQKLVVPYLTGDHLLFFTATWCDWYLADSRPAMSQACKQAQSGLNQLVARLPNQNWQGVVNHLWTDDKALADFVKLYQMNINFSIDNAGVLFNHFKINNIPTIVQVKDGKVIREITDLSNQGEVVKQLSQR